MREMLERVIPELEKRNVKRVGIQIPDGLKYRINQIVDFFEGRGYETIVSGSSCYGACDVDLDLLKEVDVLLHFAHTPILNIDRVIYVPYIVNYCVEVFKNLKVEERSLALIATAQYAWKLHKVKEFLEEKGYEVELKRGSGRIAMPGQVLGCNYTVLRDSKAEAVLFVGDGLFHPIGAKIYTGKKVYRFNPLDGDFEVVEVEGFVERRYMMISKAMEGENCGIIVSKKVGQRRMGLALRLKRKAKELGRYADIIYLDDVTPQKLENFPYDFLVNTACPRISYDDFKLFKVPILTPQEFEILLGLRDWKDYEMDEII